MEAAKAQGEEELNIHVTAWLMLLPRTVTVFVCSVLV